MDEGCPLEPEDCDTVLLNGTCAQSASESRAWGVQCAGLTPWLSNSSDAVKAEFEAKRSLHGGDLNNEFGGEMLKDKEALRER